jgi:uncharacterized membrane protein
MMTAAREKTLHRLFLISAWLKGAAGVLEILAGIPFLFVAPRAIRTFAVWVTAPELSEDPNDWIATGIRRVVHHFSADTALFAGAYLIVHGLIKVFWWQAYCEEGYGLTRFLFGSWSRSSFTNATATPTRIRSGLSYSRLSI